MNAIMRKRRYSKIFRVIAICVICTMAMTLPSPVFVQKVSAQNSLNLPVAGSMIPLSAAFSPAIIKGITIYPNNPLKLDFIVDPGDNRLDGKALNVEAQKLIQYFMASLTVPNDEMWVNLSPYEKDRIIAQGLSQTELGRDLLAQDYILKQLTASLMYPENRLGSEFWEKVYRKAKDRYGTTEIPMDTFNKIWIVPNRASVYINGNNVFVADRYLTVMLEEDYLALESNLGHQNHGVGQKPADKEERTSQVAAQIIREVLIPEIEREVNEGRNFSNLRQIFNSMILATWYKQNFKDSLLGQTYIDQNKTNGIDLEDKQVKEKIYDQYVAAFKIGVYNYIKEDFDESTGQMIPRKYFSGGIKGIEQNFVGTQDKSIIAEINISGQERTFTVNNEEILRTSSPLGPNKDLARLKELINQTAGVNQLHPRTAVHAGISITQDGFFITFKERPNLSYYFDKGELAAESLKTEINQALNSIAENNRLKIISAGIVGTNNDMIRNIISDLWFDLDIKGTPVRPEEMKGYSQLTDNKRSAMAALMSSYQYQTEGPFENAKVSINEETHEVKIDPLIDLDSYKRMVSTDEWNEFAYWADQLINKVTIITVNSTAQGGGVALMRHGFHRLLKEYGVDSRWFVANNFQGVLKGFFDITKDWFHNTFQARKNNLLGEKEKTVLKLGWSSQLVNFENMVKDNTKDILAVMIDDYQPSGMMEGMKTIADKYNKEIHFLYRSHIHFAADMSEGTNARQNWDFLWGNIKAFADLTIIHPTEPIEESVPPNVPKELPTIVMNPSTDLIDGLNKPLNAQTMLDSLLRFNEFILEQKQEIHWFMGSEAGKSQMKEWFADRAIEVRDEYLTPLDLTRPYIIQQARFDPSKNIPGVIEAYSRLRDRLQKDNISDDNIPQLVLVGNGAVDDPDGRKLLLDTIDRVVKFYPQIAGDIKIARVPHNDQILNTLLRASTAALQLSLAEGYEIKVSEALAKGIPTVVYHVGGMGRQVETQNPEDAGGFLVEVSEKARKSLPRTTDQPLLLPDIELNDQTASLSEVADHLYTLFTDKEIYERMSRNAFEKVKRDKFNFSNTTRWLGLITSVTLLDEKTVIADAYRKPVDSFLEEVKMKLARQRSGIPSIAARPDSAEPTAALKPAIAPAASSPVGGIDLNSQNLKLNVRGDKIRISPQLWDQPAQFPIFDGLLPVIINVRPTNMPLLLGSNQ